MSSEQTPFEENQAQSVQRQGAPKGPRSLTLTFAETHPWEMLVRDRLAALPRGYLKRFVLSLIENSGFDLESEEVFLQQVERLLLTKNLTLAVAASKEDMFERSSSTRPGVLSRVRQIEELESQNSAPSTKLNNDSPDHPGRAKNVEHRPDIGFGALEL